MSAHHGGASYKWSDGLNDIVRRGSKGKGLYKEKQAAGGFKKEQSPGKRWPFNFLHLIFKRITKWI